MQTTERTHHYPRDRPIDCREWISCQIVETTLRGFRIRYTVPAEEIDNQTPKTVESTADNP